MSKLGFIRKKSFWRGVMYAAGIYLLLFILVVIGLKLYTHHGKSFPVPDFKGLQPDRVKELAKDKNLRIKIVDSTFIAYLPKGSVIDQHPRPGINVKRKRTIFLTINAFNQVKVEMPDVVGVSYRQGKAILERRGLKVGKLIYKPDFAENNILEQRFDGEEVKKGTMIEKGQYIDLVLGNGLGRSSSPVPELFQLPYTRAINEINDAYFNVGHVSFDTSVISYNDTLNAMVYKQRPAFSETRRAVMGSKIDIWLTVNPELFPEADTTSYQGPGHEEN